MKICRNCGREISDAAMFCPYCGARQLDTSNISNIPPPASQTPPTVPMPTAQYPQYTVIPNEKDEGITAILALVGGVFGIWGLGHLYVGKIGRGIAILLLGLLLQGSMIGVVFLPVIMGPMPMNLPVPRPGSQYMISFLFTGIVIWGIVVLIGFIWQIFDAYNLAKEYNQYVRTYRTPPW